MTTVTRRDNESIEDALKRFKRELRKVGVLREAKKHEHYENPARSRNVRRLKWPETEAGRLIISHVGPLLRIKMIW